ncbi:DUF11 domain-containing protein, partial [uncultured Arcticibacterium sp.]|uniref:DUF11 domain-containing protein n=1 Tax=uncultured Arcticibacterium sp. TaxID=2173042 RepID=UPI0030F5B024
QVTKVDQYDGDSTPDNDDGDQSEDDEDSANINQQEADLSLTKAVSDATPNVGDEVTFTIQITNVGPDAATNVELEDYLPIGYSGIANITGGGIYQNDSITWRIDTLMSGADSTLTFTAMVNAPTGANDEYKNTTQVTKVDQYDSDSTPDNDDGDQSEDDEDSAGITPEEADLSIDISVDNSSPNVGDIVTFTVQVSNDGPDAATNVKFESYLPVGYSNISNVSGFGVYQNDTISWSIDTLKSGRDSTISFTAIVRIPTSSPKEYLAIAEVTASDQFDPDSEPGNGVITEDDYDSACLNPILRICKEKTVSYVLSVPSGYTTYQWQRNGEDIVGADSSSYDAQEAGVYTVLINGETCFDGNCCPFIIEEDCDCEIISNACVPLIFKKTKSRTK